MPYMHKKNETVEIDVMIPESESKSSLALFLPQICPDVNVVESFLIALVEPSESRYIISLSLSNINYICHHARAIILVDKDFGFSPEPHRLDTLFPPVFTPEVVNKVICHYSCLPLEQANAFYIAFIEYLIT